MDKVPRQRQVRKFAQSHSVTKWENEDLNPESLFFHVITVDKYEQVEDSASVCNQTKPHLIRLIL